MWIYNNKKNGSQDEKNLRLTWWLDMVWTWRRASLVKIFHGKLEIFWWMYKGIPSSEQFIENSVVIWCFFLDY